MKQWICTVAFLAATGANFEIDQQIDNETYETLTEAERNNFDAMEPVSNTENHPNETLPAELTSAQTDNATQG